MRNEQKQCVTRNTVVIFITKEIYSILYNKAKSYDSFEQATRRFLDLPLLDHYTKNERLAHSLRCNLDPDFFHEGLLDRLKNPQKVKGMKRNKKMMSVRITTKLWSLMIDMTEDTFPSGTSHSKRLHHLVIKKLLTNKENVHVEPRTSTAPTINT